MQSGQDTACIVPGRCEAVLRLLLLMVCRIRFRPQPPAPDSNGADGKPPTKQRKVIALLVVNMKAVQIPSVTPLQGHAVLFAFVAWMLTSGLSGQQVPTQYVHTLNATAAAIPRLIVAILETHQQADGSVAIPDALQPFMGGQTVISPEDARLLPSVQ